MLTALAVASAIRLTALMVELAKALTTSLTSALTLEQAAVPTAAGSYTAET